MTAPLLSMVVVPAVYLLVRRRATSAVDAQQTLSRT